MFNILDLTSGRLVDWGYDPIPEGEEWEPWATADGSHAAYVAATLTKDRGRKFQPRKVIPPNNLWQEREQARIASGEYSRPDYLARLERDPLHFLHLAKKDPSKLAYTKTPEKGMQDLQSAISLQGYIEMFWPDIPDELRAEISVAHGEKSLEEDGLKFATEPDDIVRVYTNYSDRVSALDNSCMRHAREDFPEAYAENNPPAPYKHPVYVYGAGDLAVAYLTDASGLTIARAMCWPARKIYTRVYASDDRLHDLLLRRGYNKSRGYHWGDSSSGVDWKSDKSFRGARLLRIENKDNEGVFVVPYSDDVPRARDDGEYLVVDSRGDIGLQATPVTGWSQDIGDGESESEYACERCGEGCDGDDVFTVYVGRSAHETWCRSCYENRTFYCDSRGRDYAESRVSAYHMANGEIWSEYAFADYGEECARNETYHCGDDMNDVVINERGDTERWCDDAVEEHTWTCDFVTDDSVYVSKDVEGVKVYDEDGEWLLCAPHHVDEHAFVSDFDGRHYRLAERVVIVGPRYVARHQEQEARAQSTAIVCMPYCSGDAPGQPELPLGKGLDWLVDPNAHVAAWRAHKEDPDPAAAEYCYVGAAIFDANGQLWGYTSRRQWELRPHWGVTNSDVVGEFVDGVLMRVRPRTLTTLTRVAAE